MGPMTLHAIFPVLDGPADRRAAESVRRLGVQLIACLSTARVLIEAGRDVDLCGMQDSVGELCARALDLPPAMGVELRPLLLTLRAEVDRTSAVLDPPTPG